MAKGLIKLQEDLHNTILKLRSIEAIVGRPQFERLWDDSSPEQQAALMINIQNADKENVIIWERDHPSLELGEKSLTCLKRIACRLGLVNYSRKGKLELIRDIQEKENYGPQ